MARIRSIKPELLTDDKTASLPSDQFRLFVALILLADDYGNLRANPRQIDAQVFWAREHDQTDVRAMLLALQDMKLVTLYTVNDQTYAHINGWSKHQKVDHPSKPLVPGVKDAQTTGSFARPLGDNPGQGELFPTQNGQPSRGPREGSRDVRATLGQDLIRSDLIRPGGDPDPDARDPSGTTHGVGTEILHTPLAGTNGEPQERTGEVGSSLGAKVLPISQPTPQKPTSGAMPEGVLIPGSSPTVAQRIPLGAEQPDILPPPAPPPSTGVGLRPDTSHNLVWCLKAAVEKAHPERGFWAPGIFGENDAARWWLGAFGDGPPDVDLIEKRIAVYVASDFGHRTGWSLRAFLADFNRIGLESTPPPQPSGRKPLSQQLAPGQRFFNPDEEDPD